MATSTAAIQIDDEVFVTTSMTEVDGSPYKEIPPPAGSAFCKDCGRIFKLCKHQAKKPCETDPHAVKHLIHVHFPDWQLPYVKDFLEHSKLGYNREGDAYLFLKHTMDKLYFAQISLYNIEQWYPLVEKLKQNSSECLTAPTQFLRLSDDELKVVQRLYTRGTFGSDASALRREENADISRLESRIEAVMEKGVDYFVRISTRSPKDSVKATVAADLPPEEKIRQKHALLKVNTPGQAMKLITKSARIFGDITNYTNNRCTGTAGAEMNLILRRWINDLPPHLEFRCFIHQRQLTCISQYYCYDVFAPLQDKPTVVKMKEAVEKFHQRVKEVFPLPSYVMDVVVLSDDSIQIVEFNPFGANMSSGSGLFNWESDYDLLYGKKHGGPHIRVLRKLLD